jgi:hypothetical protein
LGCRDVISVESKYLLSINEKLKDLPTNVFFLPVDSEVLGQRKFGGRIQVQILLG